MGKIEFKEQNIEQSDDVIITSQKMYVYRPREDITVYELALIVPIFHTQFSIEQAIEALPAEAKRHFEEA